MELTFTFIKIFFWSLHIVSPLIVFLALIITALGQIVTRIEKWEVYDGIYWSFITATTVGYGDLRPLKKRSKFLSAAIAMLGMMFTGIVIAVTVKAATIAIEKHIEPSTLEQIKAIT